jgi:putative glutathione S-transferase
MSTDQFTIGGAEQAGGRFVRQQSRFRDTAVEPVAGRYHLYVSYACPWASRTLVVRKLKGLEDAISMSPVDPVRDARGWAFTGGEYTDPLEGFAYLSEAYDRTQAGPHGRITVPVLWDKQERRVVNNESADVVRILNASFDEVAGHPEVDLYPEALRGEIDAVNARVYEGLNNGVYRAGFANTQEAYEEGFRDVFATLDWLEERLGGQRYLAGDVITEADWRTFVTLVRFDAVYVGHFKCNRNRIADMPNLWGYTRELFQQPGIAETVRLDEIKRHYYVTHPSINPTGVVPLGPAIDFTTPHGRG